MFGNDFEEDFIMRQIKNLIDAAVKLVCNVDTTAQFRREMENDALANRLIERAQNGNINEAENRLYSEIEPHDPDTLRAGLAFYAFLNDMDDDFLAAHDFSREEIQDGIRQLMQAYDMQDMAGLFLA